MKYYELDKEEEQLLESVEDEKTKEIATKAKAVQDLVAAARQANNKTRNINIRVSERLLHRLKAKAAEDGIPYQTLAASILHRNVR